MLGNGIGYRESDITVEMRTTMISKSDITTEWLVFPGTVTFLMSADAAAGGRSDTIAGALVIHNEYKQVRLLGTLASLRTEPHHNWRGSVSICQWRNQWTHLEPGGTVRYVHCSCIKLGRTQYIYSTDLLCLPLHSPGRAPI